MRLGQRCPSPRNELAFTATINRWRLREFVAGRGLARHALERLQHFSDAGITMGRGGEPVWPRGISGGVSHNAEHVAVLVARSARYTSVGVELSERRPMSVVAAASQ